MNDRHSLRNQFPEENALRTLMDVNAQIDGALLLELYESAGSIPQPPEPLDSQCQAIICRYFHRISILNTLKNLTRKTACFTASILAIGLLMLCLSQEVRATVSKWISGWEGGLFVYEPTDTDTITPDYRYQLSQIPEGYVFDQETVMPTGGLFRYLDSETNHSLFLVYIRQDEGSEMDLILTEESHKIVMVNGTQADLYYYPDIHDDSSLVWIDPETNYLLHISGWFPEDEMIALAESLVYEEREPFSLE